MAQENWNDPNQLREDFSNPSDFVNLRPDVQFTYVSAKKNEDRKSSFHRRKSRSEKNIVLHERQEPGTIKSKPEVFNHPKRESQNSVIFGWKTKKKRSGVLPQNFGLETKKNHCTIRTFKGVCYRRKLSSENNWRIKKESDDEVSGKKVQHIISMSVNNDAVDLVIAKQGSINIPLQNIFNVNVDSKTADHEKTSIQSIVKKHGSKDICLNCVREIEEILGSLLEDEEPNTGPSEEVDWEAMSGQLGDDQTITHSLQNLVIEAKTESEKSVEAPPIKKNFYFENPEVANLTKEEVQQLKVLNNNMMVREPFGGDGNIPNPVTSFEHAFASYPEILEKINKQGFTRPSSIQGQMWPILLSGRDLIEISQIGSGKTLGFLLPALIHYHGQEAPLKLHEKYVPRVLILTPTKESALRLSNEVNNYSFNNLSSICIYQGVDDKFEKRKLQNGAQIIIATPHSLISFVKIGLIDLYSVSFLVLDEADLMLKYELEPQIREIIDCIRPDRQLVLSCVTWTSRLAGLAEKYTVNPIQIYIDSFDLMAVHSVSQVVLNVPNIKKKDFLLNFVRSLSEEDKIIMFVNNEISVAQLTCALSLEKIPYHIIDEDTERFDRELVLNDFKAGVVKALVANGVPCRGLDVSGVTKVFNYDFPKNIEEYVHRVGKTGRVGSKGESVTLLTDKDLHHVNDLIKILEEADQPIPKKLYSLKRQVEGRQ